MKKIVFYVLAMLMMVLSKESYGQNAELKTLLDSSRIFIQGGQYDKALINLNKSELLVEKETVKKDSTKALIWYLSGISQFYKGNFQKAEYLWLEDAQLRKKVYGNKNVSYANTLNALGNLYWQLGDYIKAEKYILEALAINKIQLDEDSFEYIRFFNNLGNLYNSMGSYEKAEKIFTKNIKKMEKWKETQSSAYLNFLNGLGNVYYQQNKYYDALQLFTEAHEMSKTKLDKRNANYLHFFNNVAQINYKLGNYKKAETLFKEVITEKINSLGKNHIYTAESLVNLGLIYTEIANFDKAEELLKDANEIYKFNSLSDDVINIKTSISMIYEIQTQINSTHINLNQLKSTQIYNELLEVINFQIQDNFPALSENEKLNYYKIVKNYLANYQSFAVRVHQQKNLSKFPQKSLDSLKANLLELQLATKGILLQSSQKMKTNILNSQDSSLITLFGQWEKQKQQVIDYEKLSLADKAKNKINIDSLVEATNSIEKQLSTKSENFATANDKRKYTWQNIQQVLKPNEVAVEMVRISKFGVEKVLTDSSDTEYFKQKGFYPKYDRYGLTDTTYYAALLVSKNTKNAPELVILENGNDLENKHLLAYQKGIKEQHSPEGEYTDSPEGEYTDLPEGEYTGEYTAFWAKIANSKTLKSMKGRTKVYFSPDGVYHKINLNTLYNSKTKKYVLDAFDIQQVTNLKEIITTPQKPITNNKYIVLLGFPNYELENKARYEVAEKQRMARKVKAEVTAKIATVLPVSIEKITAEMIGNDSTSIATNRTSNRGEIGKLLQTREEVKTIADLAQKNAWQPALYLENEALEETVKAVNSPRILHIATHGFFNANIEEGKNANPLLRSGLLLAGAAQTLNGKEPITIESLSAKEQTEDGILTAYEVMNLNLDKTDLVVLSACETGLGEVSNGEGVYGLQRAFMVAGAKALIISLWKVDDAATSELMTSFYENYLKTGNKRKAFETAQQALRKNKDYQNPFYWGAFVMVGE